MITIHFDIFGDESPASTEFLELLGRSIIVWGHLESQLDSALLDIGHNPYIPVVKGKILPKPFSRRVQMLLERISSEPELKELRKVSPAWAKEALRLALDRNMLVHSSISGFYQLPNPGVRVEHVQHYDRKKGEKQKIVVEPKAISTNWLREFLSNTEILLANFSPISVGCKLVLAASQVEYSEKHSRH